MTNPRIQATERQRELLVGVAARWLARIDDEVAAGMTEAELEDSAAAFIDGSNWHEEVRDQC